MQSSFCISLLLVAVAYGYVKLGPARRTVGTAYPAQLGLKTPTVLKKPTLHGSIGHLKPISPSTDFQYLKKLDARVKRLSDGESDYLLSFWSDALKCFQIYPNMSATRVSVTTTCMTIQSILANPSHWERSCRWESVGSTGPGDRGGKLLKNCFLV